MKKNNTPEYLLVQVTKITDRCDDIIPSTLQENFTKEILEACNTLYEKLTSIHKVYYEIPIEELLGIVVGSIILKDTLGKEK